MNIREQNKKGGDMVGKTMPPRNRHNMSMSESLDPVNMLCYVAHLQVKGCKAIKVANRLILR